MKYSIRTVQTILDRLGYNPGPADGIVGMRTERAIVAFKRSQKLRARPYVGPITWDRLLSAYSQMPEGPEMPPWVNEITKYMHLHEIRDNAELRRWLASDGSTLGDPKKFPWCGDAVQTAIRNTLPDEPFPGAVGTNPYLARNWLEFGIPCGKLYGAIGVCHRGNPNSIFGHVFYLIGHDPVKKRVRARGGNQSNQVCDVWIDEDRMLGYRRPTTYNAELPPAPTMDSKGAVISTNEA